jgi:hypothetical protein
MNIWRDEVLKIINQMMGNAGKPADAEVIVCLITAILGAIIILKWAGKALGASMTDNGRVSFMVVLGSALGLASTAALNIYVLTGTKNALLIQWLPIGVFGLIILAIVTPLAAFMLKAKYFQALFSILLAIGAAVGIVILTHAGFDALKQGDKQFKRTKERTDTIDSVIGK